MYRLFIRRSWASTNTPTRFFCVNATNKFATRDTVEEKVKHFGQPTSSTHPHLIKPGEFVTGVTRAEIIQRRDNLVQRLKSKSQQSKQIAIIPSAKKKYMSGKIPYVFRQNSDFFYLTGNQEQDSCLLLEIDGDSYKSTMFLRPKNKNTEMWDGHMTGVGVEGAQFFGVDQAVEIDELGSYLDSAVKVSKPGVVWYNKDDSEHNELTNSVTETLRERGAITLLSPTFVIQQQRLLKSPAEQELMRQTCRIASEAVNETMSWVKPGVSEHHLFAKVDYECRMRDVSFLAYPPVVGAGANATTIHYIANSQIVQKEDAILMDAGCEYGGYTSDITRTFPADSKFTEPQRVLYEIILQVQKDLLKCIEEEPLTLDSLFEIMCMRLGIYLKEIGFIPKHLSGVDLARAAYKYCPHHVSHYLGMDVHDCASQPRSLPITPGMVFTVEPGIYISLDRRDVPTEFRGIGIRIEDDVLVDKSNKLEILTRACKKELQDIER